MKLNQVMLINTQTLSNGLVVGNYKEMCKLLGEVEKGGKMKTYQIEDWKRYFSFERQGHKYIVTKIHSDPTVKIDKKVANSLYVKFIEILLMAELSNKNGYTAEYTKTNLFQVLGMANSNYLVKNRRMVKHKIVEIPKWQRNHFYQRSNQKLTEILFSALNSMKRRCLLNYIEQRKIVIDTHARVASDDEVKKILEMEQKVLSEMGLKKKPFLQIEKFYELLNKYLYDEYEWDYIFTDYKIIYTKEFMNKNIQIVKNEIDEILKKNEIELNKSILQAINNQAETLYKSNCKKYEDIFEKEMENYWGECWEAISEVDHSQRLKFNGFFNYLTDYVENQKYLADIFIKLDENLTPSTINKRKNLIVV